MALFDDLTQALLNMRSDALSEMFADSGDSGVDDALAGRGLAVIVSDDLAAARDVFADLAQESMFTFLQHPAYEGRLHMSFAQVQSRRLTLQALTFSDRAMQQILSEHDPLIATLANQVQLGQYDEAGLSQAIRTVKGLLRSVFGTALAGAQRAVQNELGKELANGEPQLALYSGIQKSNTRPYCQALLDLVVDINILRMTPNGHGLDPAVFGGGYNCTHNLLPVNTSIVRELGLQMATQEDYAMARAGAAA